MRKTYYVMCAFAAIEVLILGRQFMGSTDLTALSSGLFFFGIIELFIALVMIFGMENRGALSGLSTKGEAPYEQQTYLWLDHMTKRCFERMTDVPGGVSLMILAFLNLAGYMIMIQWM